LRCRWQGNGERRIELHVFMICSFCS
jgi:hypothetical protein